MELTFAQKFREHYNVENTHNCINLYQIERRYYNEHNKTCSWEDGVTLSLKMEKHPEKTRERMTKEYNKKWYQEHKEEKMTYYQEHKEEKKAYYQANKDKIKKQSKEYYESHKDKMKEYNKKWNKEHKDKMKEYRKKWYQKHKDEHKIRCKEWNKEHKEEKKAYQKAYRKSYNGNDSGNTYDRFKEYLQIDDNKKKHCTRLKSNQYLFKTLKHHKVNNYEIHHCFGYDDFKHFIYIPKELHQEIHQFLRDNNISADSNHFSQIEHIITNYSEQNDNHILILK